MRAAFVLSTIASTLLLVACSSGPTAEQYFADLEGITAQLDEDLDTVEGAFNAGLLDIDFEAPNAEENLIALFQTSIQDTASSFETAVERIEEVEPPSDIAAAHGDAVSAGRRVIDEYETRRAELDAIGELADIDAYAIALADSGVRARFTEACRELQSYADRAGVTARLGC